MGGLQDHWTVVRVPALELGASTSIAAAWREAEQPVEAAVNRIIAECAEGSRRKFVDKSFGPTKKDPDGAHAFYADGAPPSSQHADPKNCEWVRPQYSKSLGECVGRSRARYSRESKAGADDEEEDYFGAPDSTDEDHTEDEDEDEGDGLGKRTGTQDREQATAAGERSFCEDGSLFKGGASANDVVQGRIGDCWLLSAMGVLASRGDLLENLFWRCRDGAMESKMRQFGFRVCRFFKDNAWYYVVIDDQLPVFAKSGAPVFAHSQDPSELWVAFLEKAYAKLHKSYDALTGGYVDGALRDFTGLACQELVLRENHIGFHPKNKEDMENGTLWNMLDLYLNDWGCMAGCSIQPDPGPAQNGAAESQVGSTGLFMRHAYSLVQVGEIATEAGKTKIVRLRNPWGFGEWKGAWSDGSRLFNTYRSQLDAVFSRPAVRFSKCPLSTGQAVETDEKDGLFFMDWEDWKRHFTVLFVAIDFPAEWQGHRVAHCWDKSTSGGSSLGKSWIVNPRHRFKVLEDNTQLFVLLAQDDPRRSLGRNQAKAQDPIGFHILREGDGSPSNSRPPETVPGSGGVKQAAYKLHLTVDLDIPSMRAGTYAAVPSTYYENCPGPYFLHIYANKPIAVEAGHLIAEEEEEGSSHRAVPFQSDIPPQGGPDQEILRRAHAFERAKTELLRALAAKNVRIEHVLKDLKGCEKVNWDKWSTTLLGYAVEPSIAVFQALAGSDELLDRQELKDIAQAVKEYVRITGSKMSFRGDHSAAGDEALAIRCEMAHGQLGGGAALESQELLLQAVRELQNENDTLRNYLDSIRRDQARILQVLLLYGNMLKCYDGNSHLDGTDALLKPLPAPPRRVQLPQTLLDAVAKTKPQRSFMNSAFSSMASSFGDEFLAVKPWIGALVKPAHDEPDASATMKAASLELEYCYGGPRFPNSLGTNSQGEAVFFSAAVGVVLDPATNQQRFLRGHTDDITCMSMSGDLVATGQVGKNPFAYVWDSLDPSKPVAKLSGLEHKRSIIKIAFSTDGSQVLTICGDDNHSVAIYEAKTGRKLAEGKGKKEECSFAVHTGERFVVGGNKFVGSVSETGGKAKVGRGTFGKVGGSPQLLSCATDVSALTGKETVVSGTAKGSLIVWSVSDKVHAIGKAEGDCKAVLSLAVRAEESAVLAGTVSGAVLVFGLAKDGTKLELRKKISRGAPVRSIAGRFSALGNGTILADDQVVMESHFAKELWGVASMGNSSFCSCGDDGTVRIWDAASRQQARCVLLANGQQARAVAVSSDQTRIAVGQSGNVLAIFDATDLSQVTSKTLCPPDRAKAKRRDAKSVKVTCVAFSPSGSLVAVGSNDTTVYICEMPSLKLKAHFNKSSGSITHLDWTADSKFIRTNDSSYELLYYNVEVGKQATSARAVLSEAKWATHSCVLSWETQGVWDGAEDGTDINAVAKCPEAPMMATADDFGTVKLFPYPFQHTGNERKERLDAVKSGKGHASHVTNVAFLGSNRIVSTGGKDRAIMQWKVEL